MLECLEARAVPAGSWNNFAGNAQHTDISGVAAQPIDRVLWSTSLDLEPWGSAHYGDPVFTPGDTVIVPTKVTWSGQNQGANNFFVEGINGATGAVLWTSAQTGSITAASNAAPIVITSSNHGLVTGDTVTIGGVLGNTKANGTVTITVLDANTFQLNGITGNGDYTGGGTWVYSPIHSSYIEPQYGWLPPFQSAYDPVTNRVYFPGPGGTIEYISNPDNPASATPTPVQEAFYGTSNYTANPSAYDASVFINTPLTVDSAGNVYFGFTETGSNPSGINDGGIARISPTGVGTYVLAFSTVGQGNDGNWNPAIGSAPALSNDGSILYVAINDSGYARTQSAEYNPYLVGLNSTTLAPVSSVRLLDPWSGQGAGVIDFSSASPMVAPDGTVFMGVVGNPANGSRGSLLHFSGNLQTEYAPGAFGWDDTPSVVPTSMVPSYKGTSPYLILSKYNNYGNAEVGMANGGNGVNQIAVLDPYATERDPNNDINPNLQVMKEIMTYASPSPDMDLVNVGDPDAVREWCTNGTVVDPATDSAFINNEDGYTYQWNLGTGLITNAVEITTGIAVPYTPTAIGPNGEVYSDNGGTLFAMGGYANDTISTVSSANPVVVGNSITFTTTVASTSSGPTPTGTVTYSYTAGANTPLNSTPVVFGTAPLVNGVATITVSGWGAAHYHVVASYSGDGNYAMGQTTLVQPVLETNSISVSASANFVMAGSGVTFTATVTPNGTSFVPIGTVTFMNGSTVLGTASLNSLNSQRYPPGSNQATFTTSGLPAGTDAITAVYSGDRNFVGGTSAATSENVATAVMYTSFVPSTSILAINELFAAPQGAGTSLTISGNTGPGGGTTSLITVSGGVGTFVNGGNAVSITTAFPGAIAAINVNFLNDNDALTLGTQTGIINLPSTNLNVTVGSGNNTLIMGSAGSATVPAVHNTLNAVTWKAANLGSTGTESVSILNASVGSVSVQQNSGPGDAIQLWGVTATGSTTLTQNNGAGDAISIDQLSATNPGSPGPTVTLVPSVLGTLRTAQGNGNNDATSVSRTAVGVSYAGSQGNGAGDGLFLGSGDTVGTAVGSVYGGPVQLTQGTGSGDYLGLANLQASATTLLQQDVSANLTGDTVGGVSTPAIPPSGNGLASPSPNTTANIVTAMNSVTPIRAVPTNGLSGAVLEQLNITQGSAGSDLVALVQLPAGATTGASLSVVGGSGIAGTLSIRQQDLAGGRSDFIFLGSYIPGSGTFASQFPPFPYTPGTVGTIGAITAVNEIVTQGNGAGDLLSVLFNTNTYSTTLTSSLFAQGNGGDDAYFQEDTAAPAGLFNYQGGSGANYIQADSNNAIGTFDLGPNVAANVLGQDNQNPFLYFVDYGSMIFA
jgi:hypothetical protein